MEVAIEERGRGRESLGMGIEGGRNCARDWPERVGHIGHTAGAWKNNWERCQGRRLPLYPFLLFSVCYLHVVGTELPLPKVLCIHKYCTFRKEDTSTAGVSMCSTEAISMLHTKNTRTRKEENVNIKERTSEGEHDDFQHKLPIPNSVYINQVQLECCSLQFLESPVVWWSLQDWTFLATKADIKNLSSLVGCAKYSPPDIAGQQLTAFLTMGSADLALMRAAVYKHLDGCASYPIHDLNDSLSGEGAIGVIISNIWGLILQLP